MEEIYIVSMEIYDAVVEEIVTHRIIGWAKTIDKARKLISSDLGQDEKLDEYECVTPDFKVDDPLFEVYRKYDLDETYYFIDKLREGVINEKTH